MTDDPIDLDDHRGMAAKKTTKVRRQRLQELEVAQAAFRCRQEELEQLLLAAPAETWAEAAAEALYIIQLYSATPDAQDPRRKALIAHALADLTRLSEGTEGQS